MTANPTLWHALECPFSMRVRIALGEKGLEYESRPVALDDVPPEVRRNTQGVVPALVVDGLWVWEPRVLLQLVDDLADEPRLMPRTAADRARVRMLLDLCVETFEEPANALEGQVRARPGTRDHHVALEARQAVRAALGELSAVLSDQDYLVGTYGLADIFYTPWIAALEELGMDEEQVPRNVAAWARRLRDRPAVGDQLYIRLKALEG